MRAGRGVGEECLTGRGVPSPSGLPWPVVSLSNEPAERGSDQRATAGGAGPEDCRRDCRTPEDEGKIFRMAKKSKGRKKKEWGEEGEMRGTPKFFVISALLIEG